MKKGQKEKMVTVTFKCPPKLHKEFKEITKEQNYVNKSEHLRELMRYEVETNKDLIKHKVIK